MHLKARRSVTLLAMLAVALHIILLGLAPAGPVAAAGADPFSVICHASAAITGDEAPVNSGLVPGHACEHCNLCSIAAPPSAPDATLAGTVVPTRILHVLRPASIPLRIGATSDPRLAQGPPQLA